MVTKKRNKGGRPRTKISWKDFDKLCELQCTQVEIANWFECSVDTIENAVKRDQGMGFSEYYRQKRSSGRISLRRRQYEAAMAGNTAMLIWLGKQWLGQKENIEHIATVKTKQSFIIGGKEIEF